MLHGGAVCTMIDISTAIGILVNDQNARKMVTTSLNCNFYRPSFAGETVYVVTRTEKIGKTVGFANCEIYNGQKELLYNGNTVMSFLKDQFDFDMLLNGDTKSQ